MRILSDEELGEIDWKHSPPKPLEEDCSYMRVGCLADGSCFFHAIAKALSDTYQYTYRTRSAMALPPDFLQKYDDLVSKCKFCPSHYSSHEITGVSLNLCMKQFRTHYVHSFRKDLADSIMGEAEVRDNILKYMRGTIEMEADKLKYTWNGPRPVRNGMSEEEAFERGFNNLISDLVRELKSMRDVKPHYILLLSDILGVDIYVVRDRHLSDKTGKLPALYSQDMHLNVRGNRAAIVIIAVRDIHYELVCKYNHCTSKRQYVFLPSEPLVKKLFLSISPL